VTLEADGLRRPGGDGPPADDLLAGDPCAPDAPPAPGAPTSPERRATHTENLRRQLEKTRGTYLMMLDSGFDRDVPVRLRFAYRPVPEEPARALAEHLRAHTNFQVELQVDADGWMVHGFTRPRLLTAASLGRFVHWMCRTGFRHDCLFDGWGARVKMG
jgi:hypothetical protein